VVSRFSSLCRPAASPRLSQFCLRQTGAEQAEVDAAPSLRDCLTALGGWLADERAMELPGEGYSGPPEPLLVVSLGET
jgi:inhibitor of KinA sporulation pathway (predicted exonuclease)